MIILKQSAEKYDMNHKRADNLSFVTSEKSAVVHIGSHLRNGMSDFSPILAESGHLKGSDPLVPWSPNSYDQRGMSNLMEGSRTTPGLPRSGICFHLRPFASEMNANYAKVERHMAYTLRVRIRSVQIGLIPNVCMRNRVTSDLRDGVRSSLTPLPCRTTPGLPRSGICFHLRPFASEMNANYAKV
ncbi:hypothetical protein PROFUN_09370 [Planoprotostelium fungivorum]|uniref:Uncharacterized protein n=1 Tax=Planoprotostelium fungivorum TaxID=1890364 RepID=A0A2P6NGW9_9EUKA|nr:hypothetical protein PROFUN_09370 [Planoprotostelium fungivorum]